MTNYPRIDRMGIELEGLWTQQRYDHYQCNLPSARWDAARNALVLAYNAGRIDYDRYDRAATRSYHAQQNSKWADPRSLWLWHDDGSVEGMLGGARGEVVSPPLSPAELMAGIAANYPDQQNASCGTHVHVSVLDTYDYERLATKEFYQYFIHQAEVWVRKLGDRIHPAARDEFFTRLKGENSYCCRNWVACEHHASGECEHSCSEDNYECQTHNCEHECDTVQMCKRALRDASSCMNHECCHDHDEGCCSLAHDHDEDNGLCDYDNCEHSCLLYLSECFVTGDCIHECSSDCYYDCEHQCDSRCTGEGDADLHTPAPQRQDDEDARYAHLNYCESEHGTIEVRLAPAWRCPEITAEWVGFIADTFQQYLDSEAPATVQRWSPPITPFERGVIITPEIVTVAA